MKPNALCSILLPDLKCDVRFRRRETLAEIERQKMKMNQLSDEITLLQRGLDKANEGIVVIFLSCFKRD